jgi:hypothetical protein
MIPKNLCSIYIAHPQSLGWRNLSKTVEKKFLQPMRSGCFFLASCKCRDFCKTRALKELESWLNASALQLHVLFITLQ